MIRDIEIAKQKGELEMKRAALGTSQSMRIFKPTLSNKGIKDQKL